MTNTQPQPNLFIIGAPKAATTSLSEYLRMHPNVFFSNPKEPHYFNDDFKIRHTYDYDKYLSLFMTASSEHKVIGEGSVFYLYSETAISNILKLYKNAKFIVMLRNPVDLVQSLHKQAIQSHGETVTDIHQAWDLQRQRRNGKNIPKLNRVKQALYYGDLAKLGEQVKRLLNTVDKNNVHFIIYDDFRDNTKTEYLKVLNFLNLEEWLPQIFKKHNANKEYRNILLKRMLDLIKFIKQKSRLKGRLGLGIFGRLRNFNTTLKKRKTLDSTFKEELVEYFRDDIKLLSELIDRNLLYEWNFQNEI